MARILLVDDEEPIRRMFAMLLMGEGHLVVTAADGHCALMRSILMAGQIDLIVTDYNMPHLNGVQMLAAMQAAQCLPPRAIMMSGEFTSQEKMDEFAQTLRQVSAKLDARFIVKPAKFDWLLDVVNSLLSSPVE